MSKVTMFCFGVMMSLTLGKTEGVALEGVCSQDSDCIDPAVCDPRTKTCLIGVGGACTGTPDKCVIGAVCTGSTCTCGTGYTANDKLCDAENNKVGGECTDSSCSDTHATCVNSYCQCDPHYQAKLDDATCKPKPGKVGGACTSATTGACEDSNAECNAGTSLCICKVNYQTKSSDLTCEPIPGKVGGACTPATTGACGDSNAECNAGTRLCTCKVNYQTKSSDLTCEVIPNKYGGSCTTGSTDSCVTPGGDPNAKCSASSNSICGCKDNYAGSIGSICIANNTYGGACKITATVDSCVTSGGDVNAVCKDSKCSCKSGYTGSIGEKCSGTMALTSSFLILIAALLVKTHLE